MLEDNVSLKVRYVDNEVFIANQPKTSAASRAVAYESLGASGLPFHEIQDDQRVITTIGLELDGINTLSRLSAVKRWRLRFAVRALLRRPFLTGAQLEVIVGHFTFVFLLNRPTLSIFRAAYDFNRQSYHNKSAAFGPVSCASFAWPQGLCLSWRSTPTPSAARVSVATASTFSEETRRKQVSGSACCANP